MNERMIYAHKLLNLERLFSYGFSGIFFCFLWRDEFIKLHGDTAYVSEDIQLQMVCLLGVTQENPSIRSVATKSSARFRTSMKL